MKALLLSQAALNYAAKNPKNHPELRQWRDDAIKLRDLKNREWEVQLAQIDGLIERLGIALGEVQA